MKRRRTTRHFKSDPIPTEDLTRLLYAARRAPTGGNVDTRRFILVTDRNLIEMIRKASPGFYGICPTLLVICTDLSAAEGDDTAIFDAGASAENIALAATAMNLGVGFVKSYPEVAVKKILNIPEGVRTEMIVKLGYKHPDQPKAPRTLRSPAYLNRYGEPFEED
ncbi:MAG: nitroreductase family protein [Candidatus Bathyarchaeia archaeon]